MDQPTHIEAMRALGEDVAIDLGLPGDAALAEAIAIALEYPRQDARSDIALPAIAWPAVAAFPGPVPVMPAGP